MEDTLQEQAIPLATAALLYFVDSPRGPGVDGRVHIVKRPFVRGKLAVRAHIPFAEQQSELILRTVRVDQREGNTMESQVPGSIPGIFPLVGHRKDVGIVDELPGVVSTLLALGRGRRLDGVTLQPALDFVMVELLAPKQSSEGLTLDRARILGEIGRNHRGVELIGLALQRRHDRFEARAEQLFARRIVDEPQTNRC